MKLTIVVLGLFIGTILLSIGQGIFFEKLMKWFKIKGSDVLLISTLKWLLTIGLFFYGISYIYRYAPSVKKRWPIITPGSILAASLMMATTYIFSFWVNHFGNFNKIYGSLGTIMVLMLLVYFNSLILIIGFELNLSITFLKNKEEEKKAKEQININNPSSLKQANI